MKALWDRNDDSQLHGPVEKIKRVLSALDAAREVAELDQPGFRLHELGGERRGVYSIRITGNWRITFGWDGEDAVSVGYEDYH